MCFIDAPQGYLAHLTESPMQAGSLMRRLERRHFILGGVGAAGALGVGWPAMPERRRLMAGQTALNGGVGVCADNTA
jgi:hypothetical protein